jgi:carboxypeptidase T
MRTFALALTLLAAACSPLISTPVPPVNPGLQAQSNPNPARSVVQLRWRNQAELFELAGSLDIFGIEPQQRTAKARISSQEARDLQARGITFQSVREPQMDNTQGLPVGYRNIPQVMAKLRELAQRYPDLATLEDVGDTWEKQQGKAPTHDIWALTLRTRGQGEARPVVLFTGGVHARELAPVELLLNLAEYLLAAPTPEVRQLLETREIVIVPMVNVDGRRVVEAGNSWQRKNTHGTGIDLNRNFDNHWNYQGLTVPDSWKRGLSDPNSDIYSGSGPASEPETQVVQNLFRRKPVALFADVHAYGELMLWPFGYSKEATPDTAKFRQLYAETVQPLGFKGGTSTEILYPTTATSRDYAYGKHKALSMTLEVGKSFRPAYGDVERMWEQLRPSFLRLIAAAGERR